MASKAEKTERRWKVIKGILWFMLIYAIAIVGMHLSGIEIKPLDVLTSLIFGSATIGIVGNWISKPTEDDGE